MSRLRAGVCTAALALGLTACGIGTETTHPKPSEPAVRGGALTIGIVQPASIDPALAVDSDSQLVIAAMCDPLVEIDPVTGTATAGMSKNIVYDDGGAGITVTLRDGVRFSDGTSVNATDVRASLSRVASDTTASPLAEELRPIAGFEFVHGDVKIPPGVDEDIARTSLIGVAQVTRKVFTVVLTVPDPEFPLRLARPWTAIVPRRLGLAPQFGRRPVCVGPYRMTAEWKPGDPEIVLERNPFYKGTNALYTSVDGYPDRITFRVYADREAVYQAFLRGEVDVARVARERLAAPLPGARIVTAATTSMEYMGLPTQAPVYSNADVRAALAAAIDRPALVQRLGRLDRIPATSVLPATMPAAVRERPACTESTGPPNLDAARARLQAANIDLRGVEVPLYFNDDAGSGNKELMEAVGAQWQAAFGLVPKLVPLTWDQFRERGTGTLGFDGPFRSSWRSPTPAPSSFLYSQLAGTNVGSTNLTRYSTRSFDQHYTFGLEEETDLGSRTRILNRLVDGVCQAMPLIPLWSGSESFAVRDTVSSADGRLQRPTSGDLNIRELYLRKPQA